METRFRIVSRKPIRSGTVNSGYHYEKVIPAYFGLQLLKDENVKSFNFQLNTSSFAKFDDMVIDVEHVNGTERFAIQLKHREKHKCKLNADEEFNKCDHKGKPKDFNILGYKKSFESAQNKDARHSHSFVLFTNATFYEMDKLPNYKTKRCTNPFHSNFLNTNDILQLESHIKPNELFWKKFYLIPSQKNVDEANEAIQEFFENELFADRQKAITYMHFFENLRGGNYGTSEISRDVLILHLTDLLLSDFQILPPLSVSQSADISLLNEVIRNFDVIFLSDSLLKSIQNCWSYSSFDESLVYLAHEYKFIQDKKLNELNAHEKKVLHKLLPYLEQQPLFIQFNDSSRDIIYSLIPLLFSLEKIKLKLMLIGQNCDTDKFVNWRTLHTLRDLKCDPSLFNRMKDSLKISLQGRTPVSLKTLSEEFKTNLEKLITPNEIFSLLTEKRGNLIIGKAIEELPEFYIPTRLLKLPVNVYRLPNLCEKSPILIHCNGKAHEFRDFLIEKKLNMKIVTFDNLEKEQNIILQDKSLSGVDQRDCLHLQLDTNRKNWEYVTWTNDIIEFDDSAFLDIDFNCVYGEPGIGKTALTHYITHKCPSNFWTVVIPLLQTQVHLRNIRFDDSEEIINFFVNLSICKDSGIDKQVSQYFLEHKHIIFLFDGLNELDRDLAKKTIKIIEQIRTEGYKVWLFCTPSMKPLIGTRVKVFTYYKIKGLNKNDQRQYITSRLKKAKKDLNNIENVLKHLFHKSNKHDDEIMQVPLNLYVLTEILIHSGDENLNEILDVNQMYPKFIDGRFEHYLHKNETNKTSFSYIIEGFKNLYFNGCQAAALQTCLESELLILLKITIEETFAKLIQTREDFMGLMKVDSKGAFTFVHYSIAEYFTAIWLSKHFDRVPLEQKKFILQSKYDGVRKFLNRKLAENCPLHLAILNEDLYTVQELAKEHIDSEDAGGRSPVHLAVSLGRRYVLLDSNQIQPNSQAEEDFSEQEKILRYLLEVKKADLSQKDKLLGLNVLKYAFHLQCLSSLEELLKTELSIDIFPAGSEHLQAFSYYAVILSYTNLLKALIAEKGIKRLERLHTHPPLLHLALQHKQTDVAKILLNSYVNCGKTDNQGRTALHEAAVWDNPDIAKLLLLKGQNTETEDDTGKTPLYYAAKMNYKKMATLLLENGANVDARDKGNRTPLQKAAYMGHTDMISLLCDKGADVDSTNYAGSTSLHKAAEMGHDEAVKCLLEKGAKTEVLDREGYTALHLAAREGHTNVVGFLLKNDADASAKTFGNRTAKDIAEKGDHTKITEMLKDAMNASRKQPHLFRSTNLHDAATDGDLSKIKQFYDSGTTLEDKNQLEQTVLHIAAFYGHLDIVEYLLEHKANTAAKDGEDRVPLHYACQCGHLEIVKLLLNKGENCVKDAWHFTPLHRAAFYGHLKVVKLLVDAGVDINCLDRDGGTPAVCASRGQHKEVMKYLLSIETDKNLQRRNEEMCLLFAVRGGCTQSVVYLLERNSDIINSSDSERKTSLHYATNKGNEDIVRILLEAGADLTKEDNHGLTAKTIAEKSQRSKILDIFKQYTT